MSWQKFLLGVGVGLTSAYLYKQVQNERPISSEKAVKVVKDAFKKHSSVDGSWIHMVPESYSKFNFPYSVYKGGITTTKDGATVQHEFVVDAKSGAILDIFEI